MQLTKKLAISYSLSLMAIFFSTNSFGYAFTQDFNRGFYWKAFPIQMRKFVTNPTDGALLEALSTEAFNEWEAATGKNLWDILPVEESSNYNGNYIRWSDNFGNDTGFDPSRTLAVTIRYNQGTFFEHTVIILNGSLSYLRQNWGNTLKITLLHEIGHTIGLDHSDQQAIMEANLGSISTLQPDDIAGMNALVDSTLERQGGGYISPYSTTNSSSSNKLFSGCGTIQEINSSPGNFLGTGFLGLLIAYVLRPRTKKIKVLVK